VFKSITKSTDSVPMEMGRNGRTAIFQKALRSYDLEEDISPDLEEDNCINGNDAPIFG